MSKAGHQTPGHPDFTIVPDWAQPKPKPDKPAATEAPQAQPKSRRKSRSDNENCEQS